jgi:hypothetical protein
MVRDPIVLKEIVGVLHTAANDLGLGALEFVQEY